MGLQKPRYQRVVLKVSGEAFGAGEAAGLDTARVRSIANRLKRVAALGVELAVVVGGGNFIRGRRLVNEGVSDSTADYMGMLATVINGLALQDALESLGLQTRLQTAIEMRAVAEPYIRRRATRHLEKKRIVILAAGTGNPHFTTDTAAALRAREISADILLKGTNVDGVFSADPARDPQAKKYDTLTYLDVLNLQLGVMDSTAITICMESRIPIIVFNLFQEGTIARAIMGEPVGTLISGGNHASG